jgi:hypothetical protein
MNFTDLAKTTFEMDFSPDEEEAKREIVGTMIDLSVKTLELIKTLHVKADSLLKEKPVLLIKELTETTQMLAIYLDIYSDNELKLDSDQDTVADIVPYEDHEQ